MTRRNIVGMLLSRFNYNRVTVTIVHISIHFIRVICGGGIRDEKRHIPADFSILPVNGYHIHKSPFILRGT